MNYALEINMNYICNIYFDLGKKLIIEMIIHRLKKKLSFKKSSKCLQFTENSRIKYFYLFMTA